MAVNNFVTDEDFGEILAFQSVPSSQDSENSVDFSEWEKRFISAVDLENTSEFVKCFRNFIENVISFVCNKTYSEQFLISKRSYLLLKKVTEHIISKDSLVEGVTKLVFEFIIEENAEYWIIKRELLKVLIDWTRSTAYSTRKAVVEQMSIIYLCKMIDSISSCGDYDFQLSIIELIFLMYGRTLICDRLKDLIPESPELSQSLAEIDLDNFEADCRLFLNTINLTSKKIFSIVCTGIQMGEDVQPLLNIGYVWVDFNLSDKAVSWYYDSQTDANDEPTMQLITLYIPEIRSIKTTRLVEALVNRLTEPFDQAAYVLRTHNVASSKTEIFYYRNADLCIIHFKLNYDQLMSSDENPILSEIKDVKLFFEKSERTEELFTFVLDNLFGNEGPPPDIKDFKFLPLKVSKPSSRTGTHDTTKLNTTRYAKGVFSKSRSEVSSNMGSIQYFRSRMLNESNSIYFEDCRSIDEMLSRSSLVDDPNYAFFNDNDYVLDSQSIQMLSGNCSTGYVGPLKISRPSSPPDSSEYKTALDYFENAPKISKSIVRIKGALRNSNRQIISERTGSSECAEDFYSMEVNLTNHSDKENFSDVCRNRVLDIPSDFAERLILSNEIIELNTPSTSEPRTANSNRKSSQEVTPPEEVNSVLGEYGSDRLGPENSSSGSRKISRRKDGVTPKDESGVGQNSLEDTPRWEKERDSQKAEEKNLSQVISDEENNNEKYGFKKVLKISKDTRKPDESSKQQNIQFKTMTKISQTKKDGVSPKDESGVGQNSLEDTPRWEKERDSQKAEEKNLSQLISDDENNNDKYGSKKVLKISKDTRKPDESSKQQNIQFKTMMKISQTKKDGVTPKDESGVGQNSLEDTPRLEKERDSQKVEEKNLSQVISDDENNNDELYGSKKVLKISKDVKKPDGSSIKQNTQFMTMTKISQTKKVELQKQHSVQHQDRGVSKYQKEQGLTDPQEQGNEEQNENRGLDDSRINVRSRSQSKKKQTPKESEIPRLEKERDSQKAEEKNLSQLISDDENNNEKLCGSKKVLKISKDTRKPDESSNKQNIQFRTMTKVSQTKKVELQKQPSIQNQDRGVSKEQKEQRLMDPQEQGNEQNENRGLDDSRINTRSRTQSKKKQTPKESKIEEKEVEDIIVIEDKADKNSLKRKTRLEQKRDEDGEREEEENLSRRKSISDEENQTERKERDEDNERAEEESLSQSILISDEEIQTPKESEREEAESNNLEEIEGMKLERINTRSRSQSKKKRTPKESEIEEKEVEDIIVIEDETDKNSLKRKTRLEQERDEDGERAEEENLSRRQSISDEETQTERKEAEEEIVGMKFEGYKNFMKKKTRLTQERDEDSERAEEESLSQSILISDEEIQTPKESEREEAESINLEEIEGMKLERINTRSRSQSKKKRTPKESEIEEKEVEDIIVIEDETDENSLKRKTQLEQERDEDNERAEEESLSQSILISDEEIQTPKESEREEAESINLEEIEGMKLERYKNLIKKKTRLEQERDENSEIAKEERLSPSILISDDENRTINEFGTEFTSEDEIIVIEDEEDKKSTKEKTGLEQGRDGDSEKAEKRNLSHSQTILDEENDEKACIWKNIIKISKNESSKKQKTLLRTKKDRDVQKDRAKTESKSKQISRSQDTSYKKIIKISRTSTSTSLDKKIENRVEETFVIEDDSEEANDVAETKLRNDEENEKSYIEQKLTQLREAKTTEDLEKSRRENKKRTEEPLSKKTQNFGKTKLRDDGKNKECDNIKQKLTGLSEVKIAGDLEKSQPEKSESANELLSKEIIVVEETIQRNQKTLLNSEEHDNSENETRLRLVEIKEIENFEKTEQRSEKPLLKTEEYKSQNEAHLSEKDEENSRPEEKKGVKDPPQDIQVTEKTNLRTKKTSSRDNENDISKKTPNGSSEVVKAKEKRKSTKIKRSLEQDRSVHEVKSLEPDKYQKESMDENAPEEKELQDTSSDKAKQTEIEAATESRNLQDDDLFAEPEDHIESNQKEVQRDPRQTFAEESSEDSSSPERENVLKGRKKVLTKKLSKKRINVRKQKGKIDNLETRREQKTAANVAGSSSDSESENIAKINKTVKKYNRKGKRYYILSTEESRDEDDWSENKTHFKPVSNLENKSPKNVSEIDLKKSSFDKDELNENKNVSTINIIDEDIKSDAEQEEDPYGLTTAGSQGEDDGSGRGDVEDSEKSSVPRNTLSGNSQNIENIEREIKSYVAYNLSSKEPNDDGEGNGNDTLHSELISVLKDEPPNVPEIDSKRISDDEENRVVSPKLDEIVDLNKNLETRRTKKSNIVKKRNSIEKKKKADGDDDRIETMEAEKEKEKGNEKKDSLEEFFSITGYENSAARKTETRESVNIDNARENSVAESDAYTRSTMEFVTNERSATKETDTEESVTIDNAGENVEKNASEDDPYDLSTLEFVPNAKPEDQENTDDIINRELREVEDKILNFPEVHADTEFPTEETVAVKEKPKTLVSRKTRKLYDPETFMESSRRRDFNATDPIATRKRKNLNESDFPAPDSNRLGNLNQTFPTTSREVRKLPDRKVKSIKETTETGADLDYSPMLPAQREIIEKDPDEIAKKRRRTEESLGEASTSQRATEREKSSRKIRDISKKLDIFETPKRKTDSVKRKPFSEKTVKQSPYYFGSKPKKTTTTEEMFEENARFKKKCDRVSRISRSVGLSDNFDRLNARFEKMIASSLGGKRILDSVKRIEKEDKSTRRHSAPNKKKSTDMSKGKVDKRRHSDKENRKMKDNFSWNISTPKKRKWTDVHTSPKRKIVTNKSSREDAESEENSSYTIPVARKQLEPKNTGKKIVIVSNIQLKPANLEDGPVDQESISKPEAVSEHGSLLNDLDNRSLETENTDPLLFDCLVGKPAPAWRGNALFNDETITIDSGEYLGKYLVLFFYPQDFGHWPEMETPKELFSLNENRENLRLLNAEIVGCSTNFISTHEAWLRTIWPVELNFPLLADPTHTISKSFMVYLDNFGYSSRAAVIIDPNGDIISVTCTDVKIVISVDEVIDKIRSHKSFMNRV